MAPKGLRPLPAEAVFFDIDEVLLRVGDAVERAAADKSLELIVHRSCDIPPMLFGDPVRLSRVLLHLAGNAVEFTQSGEVSIAVERESLDAANEEITLRFSVTDTGAGVDEAISALFHPGAAGVARLDSGSATGLAMVRDVVRSLGGAVEVASAPGIGTDFSFSLHLGMATPETGALPDFGGLRVLVVDDNDTARLALQHLLEAAGCRVDAASDGGEALETLRNCGDAFPQLILMDTGLPGMDGIETLRYIYGDTQLPHPPAIAAVTGSGRDETMARARRLAIPVDACVVKPIRAQALYRAVADAVQHAPKTVPPAPPQTIDRQSALERLGGSEELLGRLLGDFCETAADAAQRVKEAIAAGRLDEAVQRVHSAKGTAMILGMERFAAAAAHLEKALRQGNPVIDLALLTRFAGELAAAIHACAQERKEDASARDSGEGEPRAMPAPDQLQPVLERLAALIDRRSMTALEVIQQLDRLLHDTVCGRAVAEIASCLNAIDFAAARGRLDQLAASLPLARG